MSRRVFIQGPTGSLNLTERDARWQVAKRRVCVGPCLPVLADPVVSRGQVSGGTPVDLRHRVGLAP